MWEFKFIWDRKIYNCFKIRSSLLQVQLPQKNFNYFVQVNISFQIKNGYLLFKRKIIENHLHCSVYIMFITQLNSWRCFTESE